MRELEAHAPHSPHTCSRALATPRAIMEIRSFVAVTLPDVALFRGLPRELVFAFGQNLVPHVAAKVDGDGHPRHPTWSATQNLWSLQGSLRPASGNKRPRHEADQPATGTDAFRGARLRLAGARAAKLPASFCAVAVEHLGARIPMLPDADMKGLMEPLTLST
jgi:hypothetical protein